MKKAVFFDRDGTLIVDKHYLNDPEQIEYLPNVAQELRRLEDEGYILIIVTNQSGIARGLIEIEQMDAIHKKMKADLAAKGVSLRAFYYAPFLESSGRQERKPGPGLLKIAARDFDLDLSQSWMVGDKWSDVEAGLNAGCRSLLLKSPERAGAPSSSKRDPMPKGSFLAGDLKEVSDLILSQP